MEPYAVIETGGKQYRVSVNDTLKVERLPAKVGETVEISPVLAVSDGQRLVIGTPEVPDARVQSTVLEHIRDRKVVSFKQKRRKGYARKQGHRQGLTVLRVEGIR